MDDLNNDGQIDQVDIELTILRNKSKAQRQMAWTAMLSMIAATIFLFSNAITDTRVEALSDLLGLFYLSFGGIIGAYMGFTTWMAKK